MPRFTKTEQEAIILKAVWGMIDEMVNYEMFVKSDKTSDVILLFSTTSHMRLFNILLADFLSLPYEDRERSLPFGLPKPASTSRGASASHLSFLYAVCEQPMLSATSSPLRAHVEQFSEWLDEEAVVPRVWLMSIGLELDVKVSRIEFIRICGDIGKHNFLRLSRRVKSVRGILKANGHEIDEHNAYLVLNDFYEWFHGNIFAYHSSTIAEFLNNIRHAIYEYLRPEFERAFEWVDGGPKYRFRIPRDIKTPIGREMYWELMNDVRVPPYMPKFEVTRYAKMRY